jgi:8-oxo-dGTP pyrophosphatase MutT (NUDIX family)
MAEKISNMMESVIKAVGLLFIVLGLFIHLVVMQEYLNYENDRRIIIIEDKLDIVFQQEWDKEDENAFRIIEEYTSLDSNQERKGVVYEVAKSLGVVYALMGIVFILLGEYLRNTKIKTPKNMYQTYSVPISVKGIVFERGKVWLRKNERNEWELPGGKLDEGEQPKETVVREMREELGLDVEVQDLIDAHLYKIEVSSDENRGVLVVSYLCTVIKRVGDFEYDGEAGLAKFQLFSMEEVPTLPMPEFYKEAIKVASGF